MVVVFGLLRSTSVDGAEKQDEAAASQSDLLQAALLDYGVAAIDERPGGGWRVYFHDIDDRDRAVRAIGASFLHFSIRAEDVPDEDWASRSQAGLRAVRVGRLAVAPPWDVPTDIEGPVITILPSMGFGTGHHATTRLCLAALQGLDLGGRSVFDVGTGSGVLAIAASRLGASPVTAIDDDPDAVQSARDNLVLNPSATVRLLVGDLRCVPSDVAPAEVVLANLTGGLLIATASLLHDATAPGGRLILSGFMTHEDTGVLAAFSSCAVEHRATEDEWESVTLRRR
jgi:ribosomal protein L11 methyltransferase